MRVRAARRATADAQTGDGLGLVKSHGREKGPREDGGEWVRNRLQKDKKGPWSGNWKGRFFNLIPQPTTAAHIVRERQEGITVRLGRRGLSGWG